MGSRLCSFLAVPLQGHQSLVVYPDQKQLLILRWPVLLGPPLLSCGELSSHLFWHRDGDLGPFQDQD